MQMQSNSVMDNTSVAPYNLLAERMALKDGIVLSWKCEVQMPAIY